MGSYNKGEQKSSGCGTIIIVIICLIIVVAGRDDERQKKKNQQTARARPATVRLDKVTSEIADQSDTSLLASYHPRSADLVIDKNSGRSLLHVLCELNRHEVLKSLLERDAYANPRDLRKETPLHAALKKQSSECVNLLLKHGADLTAVSNKNYSILHAAAECGYYDVAKESLRAGAAIDAVAYDFTPLHFACYCAQLRLVILLCENGANTTIYGKGWTPGDLAFGKSDAIVSYLASRNAPFTKDFLVRHYDLKDGWPFLHESEIIAMSGDHPAMQAVRENSPEQLAELNSEMIELDITNQAGTPLLIIAIANRKSAAALYLAEYTRKLNATDSNGKNALIHSLETAEKDISRTLIKRGIMLNHLDGSGNSPLHYAVASCDNDIVAEMIEKGADIFAVNYFSRGMIHVAAENSNEVIFPTLIANGCDVNQEDIRGNTALHLAAKANNLTILQALLTNGADFAVRNMQGKIAADLATSHEATQLLRNRFEIEGSNPATRELPAEVRTLTTPTQDLVEQRNAR
ncbi:MAG: hypothetical protein CVV42_08625 [Candidatus Riflebacteria bacterium HGW-Riflebacteria-2]|nr:MAG: hypothetical protein CVV42_08625 [Candidatus Riflebacteria bacterium HGW-Riflebacteria-2]